MSPEPSSLVGPAAGVATSVLWALSSLLFTAATRRLGATRVNLLRLSVATLLLLVTSRLMLGAWLPAVRGGQAFDLILSGVVGLTICDQALFTAFALIGPRLVLLVNTTAPLWALVFGTLMLGERVTPPALLGMALVLGGVAWVVSEKRVDSLARKALTRGLALAAFAACLQALGAFFGKRGIGHGVLPREEHLDALGATTWRMLAGLAGMLLALALRAAWTRARRRDGGGGDGDARSALASNGDSLHESSADDAPPGDDTRDPGYAGSTARPEPSTLARPSALAWRVGIQATLGATLFGPFLGVWCSVIAFDLTELGVAQTLLSLAPVMVLPMTRVAYGEPITPRTLLGALVAVGGAALLFVS